MQEIGRAAQLGSAQFAHGGVETRGILNGSLQRRSIVIESWTPFPFTGGPGLSEADRTKLEGLTGSAGVNPARSGTPVGWVVTQTLGGAPPAQATVELFSEFFPHLWQLLLVVTQGAGRAPHAAFYIRDASGTLNTARPWREMDLTAGGMPAINRPTPRQDVPPQPAAVAARQPVPSAIPPSVWRWLWVAVPVLAIFAALVAWRSWTRPAPVEETPDLSMSEAHDQLLLRWSTPVSILADTTRGELAIQDGETEKTIPLSKDELRHGSVMWQRETGEVRVHLRIWHGGRQANAVAEFFGRRGAAPVVPPPVVSSPAVSSNEVDRLKKENADLRAELVRANARVAQSEDVVRILQNRLNIEQPRRTRP